MSFSIVSNSTHVTMKNKIVICVLIYLELVVSYPYAEEYLVANKPKQREQILNFAQAQNVPPGFYYQNEFRPDTIAQTRPNDPGRRNDVGIHPASDVPLKAGTDLKSSLQRGQNNNPYPLTNQQALLPVQRTLLDQQRLTNEFLANQARFQNDPLFQAQYAAVPKLNSVAESYLGPNQRQYQPVNNVANVGKSVAHIPKYYWQAQNLPFMNVPSTPPTSNTKKLQNAHVKIEEFNRNFGLEKEHVDNVQNIPLNLRTPNVAGNSALQRLMNNQKIRQILVSTKNKKRYMVIHPNGRVEHVDSIEDIAAKHPKHLLVNAADVNQIRNTLGPPSLSSSFIPRSPAKPLKSNLPSSPVLLPTSAAQLMNTPAFSPIVVPATHESIPVSPPVLSVLPNPISKSTVITSLPTSIKPDVNPEQKHLDDLTLHQQQLHSPMPIALTDTTNLGVIPPPSPKFFKTNSNYPYISRVLTKAIPSSLVASNTRTPVTSYPNNKTPLIQVQNSSSVSRTSNVETPKNTSSLAQVENKKTFGNTELHAEPSLHAESKNNQTSVINEPSDIFLPLTITENRSHHLTVSPDSDNKSYQSIGSNDLHSNSLTSEDTQTIFKTVQKPIAMASPIPSTPSAPIDLADLFPLSNEDNPNIPKMSNSTDTHKTSYETTESFTASSSITAIPSLDSRHNIVDKKYSNESSGDSNTFHNTQSNTIISTSDDDKYTVTTAMLNDSTLSAAYVERSDEDQKELAENSSSALSSANSLQTAEVKTESSELTDCSANHTTTTQEVSNEDAQEVHQTVSEKNSASLNSPPLLLEPSNPDAKSTVSRIPSILVDTTSATSFVSGSEDSSQEYSCIPAADESDFAEENLIGMNQGNNNMSEVTLPSYDEIWEKLVEKGYVTLMYFIEVPSHDNKKEDED